MAESKREYEAGDAKPIVLYALTSSTAVRAVPVLVDSTGAIRVTVSGGSFLKLDQTTPQNVINGAPEFDAGIKIKAGQKLYFDAP